MIPVQLTITWQTVITAAAVVGAAVALITYLLKVVHWIDRQNQQDKALQALSKHHEEDMASIKEEQTLLMFGVLACLRGLREQGCNGSVTETISKYEKYLNQKAHQ